MVILAFARVTWFHLIFVVVGKKTTRFVYSNLEMKFENVSYQEQAGVSFKAGEGVP